MSIQRLSDKSRKRIERATGLEITRAWSSGGYTFSFVVADPEHPDGHRHGWFNKPSGEWALNDDTATMHMTTCSEMFPLPGRTGV